MANKSVEMTNEESPETVWVPVKGQAQKQRPFLSPFLFLGCFVLFVGGVVVATAVAGYLLYSNDFILPGVRVLDQTLAWQTPAAAADQLEARWNAQSITLSTTDDTWSFSPPELGFQLDTQTTINNAVDYGRSPQTFKALINGERDLAPIWTWDAAIAATTLTNIASHIDYAPQDADIKIVAGTVQTIPPLNGRALDVEATLAQINVDPAQLLAIDTLPLVVEPVLPAIAAVDDIATAVESLLTTSIQIQANDPVRDEAHTWTLTPEVWSKWVSVQLDPDQPDGFTWTLQDEMVVEFINQQALALGKDRYVDAEVLATAVVDGLRGGETAVAARIYHHPREHIVQSGESLALIGYNYGIPYPWIQQANPEITNLVPGQTIIIPSFDEMLPLPVVADKRVVVSISDQRTYVYEGGELKWDWPASTGIDDSPTAPGIFQIQSHDPNAYASNWDLEMPSFMGIYRPVPTSDFMNGFHGFPTRGNSQLLWTGDLGHKVTYGCVLLSSDNADALYAWAEEGVVVEIKP